MSKKIKERCPQCVDEISMKNFLRHHIKGNSELFKESVILAKGISGVANSHPHTEIYLREQIAEYHNKIIKECKILGMCWSAIGCDIFKVEDFCRLATPSIQEAVQLDVFDAIEEESERFARYLIVILYLMGKIEQRRADESKPRTIEESLAYWIKCDDAEQRSRLISELQILLKDKKGKQVAFVILALERKGYMLSMDRNIREIYILFKEVFGIIGTDEAIRQQLEKPNDSKREAVIKSIEKRLP